MRDWEYRLARVKAYFQDIMYTSEHAAILAEAACQRLGEATACHRAKVASAEYTAAQRNRAAVDDAMKEIQRLRAVNAALVTVLAVVFVALILGAFR